MSEGATHQPYICCRAHGLGRDDFPERNEAELELAAAKARVRELRKTIDGERRYWHEKQCGHSDAHGYDCRRLQAVLG